jgi:hypothetical protein
MINKCTAKWLLRWKEKRLKTSSNAILITSQQKVIIGRHGSILPFPETELHGNRFHHPVEQTASSAPSSTSDKPASRGGMASSPVKRRLIQCCSWFMMLPLQ